MLKKFKKAISDGTIEAIATVAIVGVVFVAQGIALAPIA